LARVPAAISASYCPTSPEPKALAARRLASRASALELGENADRPFHHLCRWQYAIGVEDCSVHQRDHGDMRPAADQPRALHQFGRIAAEHCGRDRWFAAKPSIDAAPPLACAGKRREVPRRTSTTRTDVRTRLLPGPAEHLGALSGRCLLSAFFANGVLADRQLRFWFRDVLRTMHIGVRRWRGAGCQQCKRQQKCKCTQG
jgi:hypothetical protein